MALEIAFAATVFVNLAYYILFSRFSLKPLEQPPAPANFPVSLIVCARNEAANLNQNIPLWLAQEYPDFELILVNDHSSDKTLEIMESYAAADGRVRIVDVKRNENFWGSKKYALTLGIRKARYNRLLLTDADCRPASTKWLASMTAYLTSETALVLGYSGFAPKAGLLNALIRYETALTAVQYFSYAMAGMPYMGVGRNLAYTSNLFYEHSGFTSHMQLPSGDDDLFVNQTATASNTALCVHPEAFTISQPKASWRAWFRQKKRHSTTARHYRPLHQILLGLYYVSNLVFWVVWLAGLLVNWKVFLPIGLFRIVLQLALLAGAFKKLKESRLFMGMPILELFLVLLQLAIFISPYKKAHWR